MRRHEAAGLGLSAVRIGREDALRQRDQVVGLRHALREQEPQPVFLDRAAEHAVHFVAVVETIALIDIFLQLRRDVVVLQRGVRAERARRAGKAVAAFLRNRVHAHAADAELRRLAAGVVDELFLREFVDAHAVRLLALLRQVLPDVHAIEVDVLILAQRPVITHVAGEALAVERHAGHQAGAALHRPRGGQHVEDFAIENRLRLGALHVHHRRGAGDGHGFGDGADRQRRVDLRRERSFELDAFTPDTIESLQLEGDDVGAGPQVDDRVAPRAVGRRRSHLFDKDRTGSFDRHAGKNCARRIRHDTDDARALLGKNGPGYAEEKNERADQADDEHTQPGSTTHACLLGLRERAYRRRARTEARDANGRD